MLKQNDEVLMSCMAAIGNLKREMYNLEFRSSQTGHTSDFGNTQTASTMTSTPSHVVETKTVAFGLMKQEVREKSAAMFFEYDLTGKSPSEFGDFAI
uniref:Uncharacterized protein n=1 Tax=Glossina austeni TaxID=7395 RepID=A0A1A9UQU0_GLOAU